MDSVYDTTKTLRIDEPWPGNTYATAGGSTPTTYQAEASGNTLPRSCSACFGGSKVRYIGNNANNANN